MAHSVMCSLPGAEGLGIVVPPKQKSLGRWRKSRKKVGERAAAGEVSHKSSWRGGLKRCALGSWGSVGDALEWGERFEPFERNEWDKKWIV